MLASLIGIQSGDLFGNMEDVNSRCGKKSMCAWATGVSRGIKRVCKNSRLGVRIPKEHFHALEDFSGISMLNEEPENSTIVLRIQGPVSYSQDSFSSGFGVRTIV